ncbi:MAG TPA: hypothetical protein VFH06_00975 [Candidatus Saccharimonadales bacterium]|nr:hypothetical protein [Candidatus Saccharimonadales bacterium]
MTEGSNSYSVKQAALCDLIKLALHRKGGVLSDSTGRIASRLRELCGLPDTKAIGACVSNTLLLMEKDGSINRDMNEQRTRTYSISLSRDLTPDEVATLLSVEEVRKLLFTVSSVVKDDKSEMESLIETCQLAYLELQTYAAKPTVRRMGNMVALNVKGILKATGMLGVEQKQVRYYLKRLGLIRSHMKVDEDNHLWWWTVETRELDVDALKRVIEEHPCDDAGEYRSTQAGPVETRKVDSKPASLTEGSAKAPVPTPVPSRQETTNNPTSAAAPDTPANDRIASLVAIVEELAGDKEKLKRQIHENEAAHQSEVNRLQGQISQLREQLAQRSTADSKADALIAKFGPGRVTS